jgi:group I intron endonuclease
MINITSIIPITGIYKITSPSGKIYIGQSSNIHERIKRYININCKPQIRLYNSLLKYGWDNHMFEIIEECNANQLDERELYWGIKLDTLGINGLNLRLGNSNGVCSEETKRKIQIKAIGRKLTPEVCERISKAKKDIPQHTDESKKLIGDANRKPKPNGFGDKISKPILQLDMKGNIIKEWKSGTYAANYVKGNNANITTVCKGRQKSAYGFKWKYKIS